jgi:hypothetical protein
MMLKTRMRRLAAEQRRTTERLAAVEAAVTALGNEDLLDLADIFARGDPTPLREMAEAEMRRRNISL